ncbi:MAG: M23 family metallopeptidase [Clostridia bacterium]|nr:M23 family metallopeptidase [Clostridia bacterium]
MNYEENPKEQRFIGSLGFYAIIALCLIAIGVIAWFAVSRNSDDMNNPDSSLPNESYNSSNESYNDISEVTPDNSMSEVVENPVTDVPYEEDVSSQQPQTQPETVDFVLPVEGKVLKGFSDTVLQKSATYGDMRLHLGIDMQCNEKEAVKSVGSGTVTAIEDDSDFGKCISVDYGNGIVVKYCGLLSVNYQSGDNVRAGDELGVIGTVPCECADGYHLHLEAYKDGVCVSPLSLLGLEN